MTSGCGGGDAGGRTSCSCGRVALFFGWIAWDLGQDGEPLLAAFLGVVDLVALVSVFIYGKLKEAGQPDAADTNDSAVRR